MARFDTLVTVVMLAIFVAMVGMASTYPAGARFMPYVIGLPAIGLCLLQLALDLRRMRRPQAARATEAPGETSDAEEGTPDPVAEVKTWAYFVVFVAGVLLFGFLPCIPVLVTLYLWREAQVRLLTAAISAAGFTLLVHLMFERVLRFRLHEGFALDWLGF